MIDVLKGTGVSKFVYWHNEIHLNSNLKYVTHAIKDIKILTQNNISISMDAKGRSIDNIVMDIFWRTLKYEDVYPKSYNNIK